MSKIMLVGSQKITLLASEHPETFEGLALRQCEETADIVCAEMFTMDPDIVELDGVVPTRTITREELMNMGYKITESVRFIEPPDCQPAMCDIDESHSWQQMNRGKFSKKQRRK